MYTVRHAAHWTFPLAWQMPMHAHADFHELIVVVGGGIEVTTPHEQLRARPGQALLYGQHLPHRERAAGNRPLEMIYLAFSGDVPREMPVLTSDLTGRTELTARWAIDAVHAGDGALASTLVGLAVTSLSGAPEQHDPIAAVQRYVRRHLPDDLSLDVLAEVAATSRFHFARRFAAATGQTPAAFVRQARVEAARTLLLTTPMPLRTIARLVGLRDEAHLSRVFRRVTNQRPSDARSAVAAKEQRTRV